jgi:hypothetical protein
MVDSFTGAPALLRLRLQRTDKRDFRNVLVQGEISVWACLDHIAPLSAGIRRQILMYTLFRLVTYRTDSSESFTVKAYQSKTIMLRMYWLAGSGHVCNIVTSSRASSPLLPSRYGRALLGSNPWSFSSNSKLVQSCSTLDSVKREWL